MRKYPNPPYYTAKADFLSKPATPDFIEEGKKKVLSKTKITKGCWLKQTRIHPYGYSFLNFKCKVWRAHRLSYYVYKGPIPKGMMVCHTCDVRHCVNPEHLYLGTAADNNRDRHLKGKSRNQHTRNEESGR